MGGLGRAERAGEQSWHEKKGREVEGLGSMTLAEVE